MREGSIVISLNRCEPGAVLTDKPSEEYLNKTTYIVANRPSVNRQIENELFVTLKTFSIS